MPSTAPTRFAHPCGQKRCGNKATAFPAPSMTFFFGMAFLPEKVRVGLDHKQETQGIAYQEDDGMPMFR
jgi:hypothetical protein